MRKVYLLTALLLTMGFVGQSIAQQKQPITLEDIWSRNLFAQKSVSGINWLSARSDVSTQRNAAQRDAAQRNAASRQNGTFYTSLDDGAIIRYDVATGLAVDTLVRQSALVPAGSSLPIAIDGYDLSADGNKLLISTQTEPIYRRSSKAIYYLVDLRTKQSGAILSLLSKGGKQSYATFSPDGGKAAFVRDNNLFVTDLATQTEKSLTTDGKFNQLIHGSTDWVYEEELGFVKAFEWSPDGKKIAYYTFDESGVKEYNQYAGLGRRGGGSALSKGLPLQVSQSRGRQFQSHDFGL